MTEEVAEIIEAKLRFLNDTLEELEQYRKMPREDYDSDRRNELSVERLFQVGLEAMVDIARLVIIEEQIKKPQDPGGEFSGLSQEGIIDKKLSQRLVQAKGFRNVLVHEYVTVEQDHVYQNLQEDLTDLRAFSQSIAQYVLRKDDNG